MKSFNFWGYSASVREKIHPLQGFRAFAIISVLIFHFTYRWSSTYGLDGHFRHVIFMIGHFGVQVFFMISGFIIFATLKKTNSFVEFLRNRAIRLVLPAILLVPVMFVVAKYGGVTDLSSSAKALNLLPSMTLIDPGYWSLLTGHSFSWVSGVQWTLSIEIAFYIFAGLLYYFVNKNLFPEFLVAGSSVATLLDHIPHQSKPGLIHGIDKFLGLTGFPLFWWFVLGVLLYRIYDGTNSRLNLLLLFFSTSWVLVFTFNGYKGSVDGYSVVWILGYVLVSIGILILISLKNQLIERILGNKFLVWIGDNSYEFYLIHEIIGVVVLSKIQKQFHLNSLEFLGTAGLFTLALFGAVHLVRKFVIVRIQEQLKTRLAK